MGYIGETCGKSNPKTIPEFIQILNNVWYNQITFHTINLLIDSFITRLNKCIQNNWVQVRLWSKFNKKALFKNPQKILKRKFNFLIWYENVFEMDDYFFN